MSKKALFVVHTEYHMLGAISILADCLKDWDIIIIQTKSKATRRFLFVKNTSSLGNNVEYIELEYSESDYKFNPEFVKVVNWLNEIPLDIFYTFNRLAYLDFLLIKLFNKKGTKIILAPDGTAAYGQMSAFTPRWSIKVSLATHKFLWVNGFREIYWYWPTLRYGNLSEIDEIVAAYPQFVDARAKKSIKKMNFLESDNSKTIAGSFFPFDNQKRNNVIFYLNQPFRSEDIYSFEILTLQSLLGKYPEKEMVIKLHPSTSPIQKQRLSSLLRVEIVESTLPAELMIAKLTDSIVCTFWSTAALVNNPSCKFYWLYPMLVDRGIMLKKVKIMNPTQFIQLVDCVEDIR